MPKGVAAKQSGDTVPEHTEIDESLALKFKILAARWERETAHLSVLKRKVLHPAYQEIIGMGPPAVPLILEELSERPNHWMWALRSITGQDPAPDNATFDEAVNAWITTL
jgi:hypothetical protein